MTVLGRHAAAILALTAVLVLSACALSGPPLARQEAGAAAAPSAAGSATPFPAPAEAAAPAAAPPPYLPPPKQFHLGAAASALVTQAHRQAAGGDYGQAVATLERAQRIEPDNPLVWIELGRLQLGANNGAQADAMARKALSLATGDPAAQSAAWQLLADSLRARGRNAEAADADHRAAALLTH